MNAAKSWERITRLFSGWTGMIAISAVMATGIVALLAPRDQPPDSPWRESFTVNRGFPRDLDLLCPAKLGLSWAVGDFAAYRHVRRDFTSQGKGSVTNDVRLHLIGTLTERGGDRFWLKETGFEEDRLIPKDIFRLVTLTNIQISSENRYYSQVHNYIPVNDTAYRTAPLRQVALKTIGNEMITTEAGRFDCVHYRVEGKGSFQLDVWMNPTIKPLGVARARSREESLELLSFGNDRSIENPKLLIPILDGRSRLESGCTSCHGYKDCHEAIFPPK